MIETDPFAERPTLASTTAWALTVYSMMPYLGVLFLPFAFAAAVYGYRRSKRESDADGIGYARTCIYLSVFILTAQLFLWWLFYIVPEMN